MRQEFADTLSLDGKVAWVTGGGRGIGRGVALRLAEAGAVLLITDINTDDAAGVAAEIRRAGGQAIAATADAGSKPDAERMVRLAVETFGGIDILVNNAAIFQLGPALDIVEEVWDRTLNIALKGVFFHAQCVAKQMVAAGKGGRIINITSVNALAPSGGTASYDAAKGGVVAMTRSLAKELGQYGIRVNAIAPGSIWTPGAAIASQQIAAMVKDMTPGSAATVAQLGAALDTGKTAWMLGRPGEPVDIGNAVYFLASDLSSYITGALLVVDGGYLLA